LLKYGYNQRELASATLVTTVEKCADFRPSSGRKQSFSIPPDGRGVEISKEFEQQEMKYDSTGMFHWCPARTLEECVLVGKDAGLE
jgi:hypothetical protein